MKSYSPSDVRVVGFFGHRASGKTSLVEGLLHAAGATSRPGRSEDRSLTLEIDAEALARQMTMDVNVGFAEYRGVRVHVVDTPGDANFWGACQRGLQIVDAAVVTVSAADGVEPVTARVVQALEERGTPFAAFVGKLDKSGSDFDAAVRAIAAEVSADVAVLALPIDRGEGLVGIVDLLTGTATVGDGGAPTEVEVPADRAEAVAAAREQLVDVVAAADDALAERYLEEGSLSDDELRRGLAAAVRAGQLVPVLPGNPAEGIGARLMLDLIHWVFPSPLQRGDVRGHRSADRAEPVSRRPDPDGPLIAQVFRTHHDPFAGTLSFARIWSGTLTAGMDAYNVTRDASDRPSHVFLPQGGTKAGVEVERATAGDLVALTKLKTTHTGDTLTSRDDPTFLEPFAEPEALLSFGVRPASERAEDKMAQLLHKLVEEDPSLRFARDPESGEMLLGGLGQVHVDTAVARLAAHGVEVVLTPPRVPYRETLRTAIRGVEGKHKKQTGGSGQYGVCTIDVEPLPRGSGIEFVDEIVGGAIPRNYIPSVEKGVREALRRGPISGNEMVDLKVTLTDGKYHRVDSSDVAFQAAGRKAIRAALASSQARPVLLEPYMEVAVTCPADHVGDVMGDLSGRRARVHDMVTEGGRGRVHASVPMNEILTYTNALKSITSGRGSFTMRFEHYEEAPGDVQKQVAASHQAAVDED